METILTFVANFVETMLGVGTQVIEFIMTPANSICLVPLIAWLCVLGVKMVRTLYKG